MRLSLRNRPNQNWTGHIHCPQVHESISIFRDRHGIPYVKAKGSLDAWFGLGFCQGQDRAFQIEISKRNSNGSLSEILGSGALPADKLTRVIGFHRLAKKYIACMENQEKQLLEAFTSGINEGVKLGGSQKPLEFSILDIEFSSITPVDVLAHHLLLTFSLSHWVPKVTRYKLLLEGNPEIVSTLDPVFAPWNYLTDPVGTKAGETLDYLLTDIQAAQEILNVHAISNNWVIAPRKSATGHPIIANDPHLSAGIPAPWYLATLECDDFRISGACLAGSPLFLAGHNYHVSWGVTAAYIDNIDLYLEDESEDGQFVKRGNETVPYDIIVEEIKVRGEPTQLLQVPLTDRGPILSGLNLQKGPSLTMTATWMKPKKILGFFRAPYTKTIQELNDCFEHWPLFSLNLVSADDQDNTSWLLCGEIPLRKKTHGLLPMPGWDPAFNWEETVIAFADHPKMINPDADFIATANNKPNNKDQKVYIGRDFIDGYRHARIIELIQNHQGKINLDACKQFQLDRHSRVWSDIRASVLAHQCSSQTSLNAQNQLNKWDGIVSAASLPATIFEAFMAEFTKLAIQNIGGNLKKWVSFPFFEGVETSSFGMSRISQLVSLIQGRPENELAGNVDELIEKSLTQAWQNLGQQFGSRPSKWKWGTIRPLVLQHVLSLIGSAEIKEKYSERFNLGPIPIGGDEQCIAVAAGDPIDITARPNTIPNLRMVVEVGNWEKNSFSLAGGISGDPQSFFYDNLFKKWEKGKGISLKTSSEGHKFRLSLQP